MGLLGYFGVIGVFSDCALHLMIPMHQSSDPGPETEQKMQLRMKMVLLGAQSGCNRLCKAGDRVCTRHRAALLSCWPCVVVMGLSGQNWCAPNC